MERTYKKIEIVGISETSFGEARQNTAAKAVESLQPIDWLAIALQSVILSRLLTYGRGKLHGTNLQKN